MLIPTLLININRSFLCYSSVRQFGTQEKRIKSSFVFNWKMKYLHLSGKCKSESVDNPNLKILKDGDDLAYSFASFD